MHFNYSRFFSVIFFIFCSGCRHQIVNYFLLYEIVVCLFLSAHCIFQIFLHPFFLYLFIYFYWYALPSAMNTHTHTNEFMFYLYIDMMNGPAGQSTMMPRRLFITYEYTASVHLLTITMTAPSLQSYLFCTFFFTCYILYMCRCLFSVCLCVEFDLLSLDRGNSRLWIFFYIYLLSRIAVEL